MENSNMITVRGLVKVYKNFKLDNINLNLERGKIMGFIGPNGAGKSTTIKCIMGINNFNSGEIFVNGLDIKTQGTQARKIIGYVGEQSNIYDTVTIKDMYKFVRSYYPDWDESTFNKLIQMFHLNLNQKIKELSKGNCVKFMLSLAISHNPKLLILDEPTSGLDPIVREEILNIIKEMVTNKNTTVFFSSHITEDIEKIADQVMYINGGKGLLTDEKNNIMNNYRKIDGMKNFKTIDDNKIVHKTDGFVIVSSLTKEEQTEIQKDKNVTISSIRLDDLLLYLTKEEV